MTNDLFTLATRRAQAEIELGRRIDAVALRISDHKANIALLKALIADHEQAIRKLEAPVSDQRGIVAEIDTQLLAAYDATVPPEHEGPVYFSGNGQAVEITVRKPNGKASVVIDDHHIKHPEDLPEGCFKPLFEPLKNVIYKRLSKGEVIEGCSLRPGERTVNVEVKTND